MPSKTTMTTGSGSSDDARMAAARARYARMLMEASGATDPRIERAFANVRREAFLPPPPWQLVAPGRVASLTSDPADLYQDALVAIDRARGINNGEPALHAGWIDAVAPRPGEHVSHVGAGGGYYSAILSLLVLPDGAVDAYEVEAHLAEEARENLRPFTNVRVLHANAVHEALRPSDIVYVNAGVAAPPPGWLKALRPSGRMIFPWRPSAEVALALLVTREAEGYAVEALGGVWFIPCVGASDAGEAMRTPKREEAALVRSIILSSERAPDSTAVAIYADVWFSTDPVGMVVRPRR
jgi:protein-L-isoaspartate(D-aspartate) O-methyltransferase